MRRRGRYLFLLIGALMVMMLAAVSVNAAGTGSTQSKVLSKPHLESASNTAEGIRVLWEKQTGVKYYKIYRSSSGEGTKYIGKADGTKTGFVDKTVKFNWGKLYTYSAYAIDSDGKSSAVSNKCSLYRVMPVKFTSKTATSYSTIELKFKLIGTNKMISGYQIEYATTSADLVNKTGSFKRINMGTGKSSYTIKGLSASTKYYIKMRTFYRYKVSGGTKINYSRYTGVVTVATPAKPAVYRALCIGNCNYQYASDLEGPANDAKAVSRTLEKYHYITTKKTDLKASQILSSIDSAFSGATSKDVSLFFYSGHGANNSTGTMGYIMGVESTGVSFETLAAALNKIPGKVVVILDSCDSGNAIVKNADYGVYDPAKFNRAAIDVFAGADSADTRSKNGELRTNKFLVITGGTKNEETSDISMDGKVWGGLFARSFVEGAGCNFPYGVARSTIPADTNSDKKLTLTEMYNYTKAKCAAYKKPQHVQCYPAGSNAVIMSK